MSIPVERGRIDLLILAFLEDQCKAMDPRLSVLVWDQLGKPITQAAMDRAQIPNRPINGIRLGGLHVPLETVQYFAELAGLVPKRLGQ